MKHGGTYKKRSEDVKVTRTEKITSTYNKHLLISIAQNTCYL